MIMIRGSKGPQYSIASHGRWVISRPFNPRDRNQRWIIDLRTRSLRQYYKRTFSLSGAAKGNSRRAEVRKYNGHISQRISYNGSIKADNNLVLTFSTFRPNQLLLWSKFNRKPTQQFSIVTINIRKSRKQIRRPRVTRFNYRAINRKMIIFKGLKGPQYAFGVNRRNLVARSF